MTHESLKMEIEEGSRTRLHDPIVSDLYEYYSRLGLLDCLTDIVGNLPQQSREPVIHTLTSHITKEKPVFIFGLADKSNCSVESKKGISSAVDFLWSLSLMYDDIFDNDQLRAGKISAWKKYGSDATLDAVYSGIDTTKNYLSSLVGSHAKEVVDLYANISIQSVSDQKKITLDSSRETLLDNYNKRMAFHTNLPIDLLFPQSRELNTEAYNAISTINIAGQVINDLKDMSSEYGWLRASFSDIRSGIVTIPMWTLWHTSSNSQKEKLDQIFGNSNPDETELKFLANCFTPEIMTQIKSDILQTFQISSNLFSRISLPEVSFLANKWIDSKTNQLDNLKI